MEEKLISFETAQLLKTKKFDVECRFYSFINDKIDDDYLGLIYKDEPEFYWRPTQSLLQKWLREVHNIYVFCIPYFDGIRWHCKVLYNNKNYGVNKNMSYEEVLEIGLLEALNLLPNV